MHESEIREELGELNHMAEFHLKCVDWWNGKADEVDRARSNHLGEARALIARQKDLINLLETGAFHA